jgi:hypothetical protein
LSFETVTDTDGEEALYHIYKAVFGRGLGLGSQAVTVKRSARSYHLLARERSTRKPVGAVTVVETTGEHKLHRQYGLSFADSARVAQYTQLGILKEYRGMNISLMLMCKAHHRFVRPYGFHYTWLLFDADRARSSYLNGILEFTVGVQVFVTEWGRTRVMVREEGALKDKDDGVQRVVFEPHGEESLECNYAPAD